MYHIIRKRSYFEGWYLKQQTESKSIALIPSFHADADRQISARLQIITEDRSLVATFSSVTVDVKRNHFFVRMGNCIFFRQRLPPIHTGAGCKYLWKAALSFHNKTRL